MLNVVYGNYVHPPGEAGVQIQRSCPYDPTQQDLVYMIRWRIYGIMVGANPEELAARCLNLDAAYSLHGRNAAIMNGVNNLQVLDSPTSFTGVRVVEGPSYPRGDGPELATERTFEIVLEASYDLPSSESLAFWQETLTFSGGGPTLLWVPLVTGDPRLQMLTEKTTYKAIQMGTAIGKVTYPTYPAPLWPSNLMENPQVTFVGPQRRGLAFRNYQTQWQYRFEGIEPMSGQPTPWPAPSLFGPAPVLPPTSRFTLSPMPIVPPVALTVAREDDDEAR